MTPAGAPAPRADRGVHRLAALLRQRAVVVWLALVAIGTVVAIRTSYVADLSAFLPSSPSAEQAVLLDQIKSGIAARLVLIGIEGGSAADRRAVSLALGTALRASRLFDAVQNGDNTGFEAIGRFLFANRYLLSPAVDATRFSVEGLRAGIDETTALLGTPAGALVKPVILRDPTGETVRMAESMLPSQAPRNDGGVWVSRRAARAVLLATIHAEGADLDSQQRALERVRSAFAPYAARGLHLIVSGSPSFAVDSRARIKGEVERLAAAGGIAIVGLLLLAFGGSLATLAVALLPVVSGVIAGIAAVSLVFGQVHGITLGFGTTLIGEAVDYAIYYLIQARRGDVAAHLTGARTVGDGARRWLADNWPTVRLGLWTSICGFAALLGSGFPGLRQLGLFSIAGLAAAALTTRWVLTRSSPDGAPGTAARRRLGRALGGLTARLPRLRWPFRALAVAAAIALVALPSAWRGDLLSLSPIGAAQLQLDADLRADLGASESGLLVAVAAPAEAGALAAAEAVGARLDRLAERGAIGGYESPARLLPSPATQTARRAALPEAATLAARLAEATVDGPLPAARLDGFVADVQAARTQPLLTRESLRGTPLLPALDALLTPGDATAPWRALLHVQAAVLPGAPPLDAAGLRAALAGLPTVQVVDIGTELTGLYARYLREAGWQALLGAAAVVLLLALHLRSARRLWRVAQPIAAAVIIVLGAFSVLGSALGILHLVGLLLTVAIGSNYALFFDQLREAESGAGRGGTARLDLGDDAPASLGNRDTLASIANRDDTLASLALANLTAVVSFGLLACSGIPALYAVGEVVAPGILLCLLLSAAFIPVPAPEAPRPDA